MKKTLLILLIFGGTFKLFSGSEGFHNLEKALKKGPVSVVLETDEMTSKGGKGKDWAIGFVITHFFHDKSPTSNTIYTASKHLVKDQEGKLVNVENKCIFKDDGTVTVNIHLLDNREQALMYTFDGAISSNNKSNEENTGGVYLHTQTINTLAL
jgi:hypothetical protein